METSSQNRKNSLLFKKYLSGKCNDEEKKILEDWYSSFEDSALPGIEQEKLSLDRVRKSLLSNIRADLQGKNGVLRLPLYFRIAAMVTLISSVSVLVYFIGNFALKPELEFHASNGQIKVVNLQDGSVVTLNSGSTLKISSDFEKTNRSVELSGEAYFQVTKNASKPFIVRAGPVSTRVLGTAFNIQAYKNDRLLAVTVTEGKVRVERNQKILSQGLTPGLQLIYNKDNLNSNVAVANAEQISAWRSGTLYFDNESIPDIAKRLERKFNVQIKVVGILKSDCRYTLRISNETLDKTLRLLSVVAGIKYKTTQQNQIVINTTICR